MARKIEIEVTGDTRNLEKALGKAQKSAGGFQKGMEKASKGALVALGALGVGAALSVKAASDLGEQINKTAVVFRGSEKSIHAWSETTAASFGISQRAALEAAGTFGNMLVPMGLARDKAGEMSTRMVELAADMASFNNADPSEVLDSLRAGLSGESEPLRRFGVFLNDARVKQEAVRLGLMKTNGVLSSAAKAQATYSLILKDTGDAQGDFANTSDSLANQQRILKAELENTAAALGTALIPAATAGADVLLDLVHWTQEHETAAKTAVIAIAGLSAGILVARASLAIYTSTTLAAIGATTGLRVAMAATPWGLAAVAASGLIAFIISQAGASDDAEDSTRRLTDAIQDYHDAIKQGNEAREEYGAASRRVEAAEIAVKRAVEARNQVDKDSNSTLLDRREADLRVADAMAERRKAENEATGAGMRFHDQQLRTVGALGRAKASVTGLAEKFRNNLTQSIDVYQKGAGKARIQTGRLSESTGGRANAEAYADKLRELASKLDKSQDSLRKTARLAATLADAWGRVVSLPEAKEFVARFKVITTVEEHRLNLPGRAAGGPVTKGQPVIVGEYRPEVFVPSESGRIVPRVSSSNGGGAASGPLNYVVLADRQVVDLLRRLDGNERRRNGGKGIL